LWIDEEDNMNAITFDTLKYVKTLKAAGFEKRQAEALAEVHSATLTKCHWPLLEV
jgi:hypothetical protein